MLSEVANGRVLQSIRLALSQSPPDVESAKSMVAALNPCSLPTELFNDLARAYTIHGGKEYAREDVSHGDFGILYAKAERPEELTTTAQSKGVFADSGPINTRA